jgi:uncharacterized protein (UPF0332 family)
MARITERELLLVSKANQEKLKNFADGASLTERSKKSIRELQLRVAADRLRLARRHLKDAQTAHDSTRPSARTVVSRAYYSLYHAARAVAYIHHQGDDYEAHAELPQKLPADFPNGDVWKVRIKEARYERNRADYDPYPASDADFQAPSIRLLAEARELIKTASAYIKAKQ